MRMGVRILFLILLPVWAGIIIGVSLFATSVKFQAPSLTLQAGLEVGRYTFRLLGRVDFCLLISALATTGMAQPRSITTVMLAMVIVIVALQRFWLLPFLDKRVSAVLASGTFVLDSAPDLRRHGNSQSRSAYSEHSGGMPLTIRAKVRLLAVLAITASRL